ncbi:MAG: hypothetical protein LBI31_03175 [Zoogloeaceae bacterium]|jgi:hypothetical protein|nr:hypothetical protein [Zoogloeaceae bacterium]
MKTPVALSRFMAVGVIALVLPGCEGQRGREADDPNIEKLVLPVSACDPGLATCVQDMPEGGRLTVDFSVRSPQALQPFIVRAAPEPAEEVRAVRLDLSGVEMDIGVIHHDLARDAAGHYQGEVVLPICVTGSMQWRVDVIVENDRGRVITPLHFSNGLP